MLRSKTILFTILAMTTGLFAAYHCGTAQLIQQIREHGIKLQKAPAALVSEGACTADDFYDTVQTRTTDHFQIFYTLRGIHKTTVPFIDTLAKYLEKAWSFHVQKQGMRAPRGGTTTLHYQQEVQENLYPVEVLDLVNMRTAYNINIDCTAGCFGITLPDPSYQTSFLLIDNDFRYSSRNNKNKETLSVNGKNCTYRIPDSELENSQYGYSYAQKWNKAIEVTTAHELYHTVQLRYLDLEHYTFWFEASAVGIEEILAPDIDDYFSYISAMSSSTGTPLDNMIQDYGAAVLYLYLYNHIDPTFDKSIWESFAKNPDQNFQYHLTQYAEKKGLSADSIFHDFSIKLSFSGDRSFALDTADWIHRDQSLWSNFTYRSPLKNPPTLQSLSYQFLGNGNTDLEGFLGRASLVLYKDNNPAEIRPIASTNDAELFYNDASSNVDSVAWVLSHFGETEEIPLVLKDSTLRAYPVPWRNGSLCFSPLPSNKNYIEIRNRRGNLVHKEPYDGSILCLDEAKVKALMAPGIFRFRAGNSGKLHDFIVIY